MSRAGTYTVVTTGTPKHVRRRQSTSAYIGGAVIGVGGTLISQVASGLAETAAVVVVGIVVFAALGRWFIAPVSPHLTLDPEEHEQVDELLARGAGPSNTELREALAAGKLTVPQMGQLRDVVHAEAERLYAVIDDKAVKTPKGMLEEWQDLERIDRRLKRLLRA